MGIGLGLASTASTAVGTEAAPAAHRGVAAGLLNATAQIGTALGLALVAPLASLGGEVGATGSMDAGGMRWGFAVAGLIAVLGLAGSRLLPTRRRGARDRAGTRAEAAR
jgi:sugar phosphate permease